MTSCELSLAICFFQTTYNMYFAGVQPHDIALVKLPRAVPFTPACLPRSSPRVGSGFEIAG